MQPARYLTPLLCFTLIACANDPEVVFASSSGPSDLSSRIYGRSAALKLDIADADLIQRTCALYVAVRSRAWKDQISFGRDMDSTMVRWNTCPGGTMVACAVVPTANGDSVITGIPWSYAASAGH